jgi:hypothetical protein
MVQQCLLGVGMIKLDLAPRFTVAPKMALENPTPDLAEILIDAADRAFRQYMFRDLPAEISHLATFTAAQILYWELGSTKHNGHSIEFSPKQVWPDINAWAAPGVFLPRRQRPLPPKKAWASWPSPAAGLPRSSLAPPSASPQKLPYPALLFDGQLKTRQAPGRVQSPTSFPFWPTPRKSSKPSTDSGR